MVSINKIRAVGYAVKMRLKGYKLLQNPKGAPQTEVNVIRKQHYVDAIDYGDRCLYRRFSRTFGPDGVTGYERTLNTVHHIDPITKQKNGKKQILYIQEEPKVIKSKSVGVTVEDVENKKQVLFDSIRAALRYSSQRSKIENATYSGNEGFWAVLRKNLNNQ